ncbi:hypothetical protein Ciccas_005045, partial [Cichlidogyrus casuarinus]
MLDLKLKYRVMVRLSDHSGSYQRGILMGEIMEKLCGVSAQEFVLMSSSSRAKLKWNLLLNRFK